MFRRSREPCPRRSPRPPWIGWTSSPRSRRDRRSSRFRRRRPRTTSRVHGIRSSRRPRFRSRCADFREDRNSSEPIRSHPRRRTAIPGGDGRRRPRRRRTAIRKGRRCSSQEEQLRRTSLWRKNWRKQVMRILFRCRTRRSWPVQNPKTRRQIRQNRHCSKTCN